MEQGKVVPLNSELAKDAAQFAVLHKLLELGRAIRACVQQAELERADDLAEQHLNCLRNLFADPAPDRVESGLADWVQAILREDRALMDDMAELRERMQLERGDLRKSTRSALAYAETERG